MSSVVFVDPFRCRMWDLHDRIEGHITPQTCKAEIESFLQHGQLVSVLGRPLRGDPTHDVELVFGARRLFVARHINKPLAVELRELSDQEAIAAMDIENRQRMDISPYERGFSYARWLRAGYFKSQDDIARALNVSASQVSRLVELAKLPSVIVNAFNSAADIREAWGLDLMEIWKDPGRRAAVAQKARAIAAMSPRPAARKVYRQLLATAPGGRTLKERAHDDVVLGENGVPLFRIKHQSSSIALFLPAEAVVEESLSNITQVLADILQDAKAQSIDPQRRHTHKSERGKAPQRSPKPS